MRITAFFLLGIALQISAASHSQTISFHAKQNVLQEAFKAVEAQTGYVVFYTKDILELGKVGEISVKNMPLKQFMDVLLMNQPLKYVIENNSILISKRVLNDAAHADKSTGNFSVRFARISGMVKDSTGTPLAGATVQVRGTNKSTSTDANGNFTIDATSEDILVVSFVGFERYEIKVGQATTISITLHRASVHMDEVAVVNTGFQRLAPGQVAGAIVEIKMKDIELDSKFSVDQMLASKVPGLMSMLSSGEPGATPKIRIRGTSSIIGGSAPLWVLDDIILENPVNMDLSNLNSPDAHYLIGNAIAGINARDIETITVLKDASATAIYGSRAANGVIVVTTKKGRVGKPQVNYAGSFALNQRISYGDLKLMNSGERVQLSQEIIKDNIKFGRVPRNLGYEGLYLDYLDKELSYDEFKDGVLKMSARNTDWYDLLFRNSLTANHSINLSGGSDRTTYYASLGYTNAQGTAKGSDQTRYSGMVKINSWLSDKVFVGFQVNASNSKGTGFHGSVNPNQYAYETARTIPAFNDDGSYFYYQTQQKSQTAINVAPKQDMLYNILNEASLTGSNSNVTSLTSQLNLEYRFGNGFKYRFLGGYDMGLNNTSSWAGEASNAVSMLRRWNVGTLVQGTPEFDESVIPWGGIISNNDQRKVSYTVRNTMEYNKMFAEKHLVSGMVAQEVRGLKYKGLSGTYYGWQPERGNTISPALTTAYAAALNGLRPIITDNVVNNVSWLASGTYSYKDKLTFNGNIRADGSNNFGDNPKYRFLPIWSIAGKYTISNEEFLMYSNFLSYFAIRASYGLQGNIDKSTSPDLIIRVGSKDGITGLNESYFKYLANPDLRWEKTSSYNLGFDYSFFRRKEHQTLDVISGTIDIYSKKGTDIIVARRISQVIGLDQVKINGGKVNNSGIEGNLRIVPYQTRDFSASLNVVASYNRNVLVEANKEINTGNTEKLAGVALVEGMRIGSFYSFPYAGLNASTGYPMFYNDKGEKRYELYQNELELVYSGVAEPDISGGFDVSVRYKGLYTSLGFQYALGGVTRLPNFYRTNYYAVFDALANTPKELNTRWRAPGDELHTNIPVIYDSEKFADARAALKLPAQLGSSENVLGMYDRSDIRTAKMDNLRLRNITINYLFPQHIMKRLGVASLGVKLQAENIFLFANNAWQGRDPESGASNTPLPKVYTFGVNVGF